MPRPLTVLLLLATSAHAFELRSRGVEITPSLHLTVYEHAAPSSLVQSYYAEEQSKALGDPFGLVLWPGALFASRLLASHAQARVKGKTCLIMGAGTGLEALAAAALGAEKVVACDNNRLTLELLMDAARDQGWGDRVETRLVDLSIDENLNALPAADVHIFSDVLYTLDLSAALARRCRSLLLQSGESDAPGQNGSWVLVTDSQGFHSKEFLEELNGGDSSPLVDEWQRERLEEFTGSGVLLDSDQTYSPIIRFLDLVF